VGNLFSKAIRRAFVTFSLLAWVGCGGGSNSGGSNPPPPPGTFTLSVTPTTVALALGASQNVQVDSASQNGFSGSITITATGLPSGVTVSPASLVISAGNSGTLVFSVTSGAASGNVQVSLSGVSGSQQASAMLALDVLQTATPIAMPFTTTGGMIVKAFYDESRQLLFACNLYLNEVDVLSGTDLSLQTRIPIPQPFGIDQMPDGNTLVVGTATQGFYTIDENTLSVTQYLAPNLSEQNSTLILLIPVTMANGNVLFIAKDIGAASGDIFVYAGQSIVEWNSATGNFSEPIAFPYTATEIVNLKRSADHNWAAFSADQFYIYSSAQDSFTSSAVPENNTNGFGVQDMALNSNGSEYAVVSAFSVSFYDSALNLLGTTGLNQTSGFGFQYWGTQFSSDDSLLYWKVTAAGSVLDVVNTTTFDQVGTVTAQFGTQTLLEPNFLWIDSKQRAFFAAGGGVGLLDCNAPRTGTPNFIGPAGPNPFDIPLNQSAAVSFLNGLPIGTSVTVNGQIAPVASSNPSNNPVVVEVPASSVLGPVNLVFTQPDGESMVEPQNFVYGVDVAAATSNLVPPIGNPALALYGYGILNAGTSTPTAPTVTVGGQPVKNVAVNLNAEDILQGLYLQLPNGTPGPSNIVVTADNGTGTLTAGITYIPSATIVRASGLEQLLYDTHRSLLYALQSTQVQVFDPSSLTWTNPLVPGGSGGVGYVWMAMTPDGTQLLVLDGKTNTLTAFNPDNPSQSTATQLPTLSGTPTNVAATSTSEAFIGGTNPNIEFDLATNTYKLLSNSSSPVLSQFVATADGNHVAAVVEGSSSGTVAVWNSSGGSFTEQGVVGAFWTDLAISSDGNLIAPVQGNPGYAGVSVGLFNGELQLTNVNVYPDLAPPDQPAAQGALFSTSGMTLLTPLADSIDFFNTQTGTLRSRLLMPELLPVGNSYAGVLALDPNQQVIYAISASGLTVVTLPSVVDQLTPFAWPYIAKPSASSAHSLSRKSKARTIQF
jgi:hypothetical protein